MGAPYIYIYIYIYIYDSSLRVKEMLTWAVDRGEWSASRSS